MPQLADKITRSNGIPEDLTVVDIDCGERQMNGAPAK